MYMLMMPFQLPSNIEKNNGTGDLGNQKINGQQIFNNNKNVHPEIVSRERKIFSNYRLHNWSAGCCFPRGLWLISPSQKANNLYKKVAGRENSQLPHPKLSFHPAKTTCDALNYFKACCLWAWERRLDERWKRQQDREWQLLCSSYIPRVETMKTWNYCWLLGPRLQVTLAKRRRKN